MTKDRTYEESYALYVRKDDSGQLSDTRAATATQMMAINTGEFISFMGEVPGDVAAIFSCWLVVAAGYDLKRLRALKSIELVKELKRLRQAKKLPLCSNDSKHGPEALTYFEKMVASLAGAKLYLAVAELLSTNGSKTQQEVDHDNSQEESVEAPASADDGNLFDSHPNDIDATTEEL